MRSAGLVVREDDDDAEQARFHFGCGDNGRGDDGPVVQVRADVARFTDIKPTVMLGKSL